MMKKLALVFTWPLAVACSATPEISEYDQTIGDYVSVGELEPVKDIRTENRDRYTRLTDRYVIYTTRSGDYLLYFDRPCRELNDLSQITPDQRRDDRLRAGFDTLRGCRIHAMYAMTEAQAEEISIMGDGR